ncbi:myosin heavy chain, cardiac muscle isoform-like [Hibiscus syriacus]|uniref:myosin heavy chain, cardiac muscle isoform-like n=1 Tax=Hibiscus syriacus TaxID=106335 RepID=UPI0019211F16|nr:myosin heavy chain, cardiac muscle isoform-like [Hibiscus syriacus]
MGNSLEEWITGGIKVKKNCMTQEDRAKKFSHDLRVAEEMLNTTIINLERCQAENQMLNMVIINMEDSYQIHQCEIEAELEVTKARNKKLIKFVDLVQELIDHKSSLTRENEQYCLQIQELTCKIKEKDNVIKEVAAHTSNVAHKLIDLAGFT